MHVQPQFAPKNGKIVHFQYERLYLSYLLLHRRLQGPTFRGPPTSEEAYRSSN